MLEAAIRVAIEWETLNSYVTDTNNFMTAHHKRRLMPLDCVKGYRFML
jgi:hypothetical protein